MLPLEITARRWQRNLAWTTTEASLWMTKNLGISQLGRISLSKKQVLQVTEPTCAWGWDGIYPEGVIFLSPVSTPSYITKICSRSGFFHSILPPVPSLTPLPKCSIRIFHSIKQKGRLGNQTCSPVLYMSMQKSDPLHSVGSTPMLACTGLQPWSRAEIGESTGVFSFCHQSELKKYNHDMLKSSRSHLCLETTGLL